MLHRAPQRRPGRLGGVGDRRFGSGILGLRSNVASPQKVDAAVVSDSKQPGPIGRLSSYVSRRRYASTNASWTTSSPSSVDPVMRAQ
jgi:hypothetical protein